MINDTEELCLDPFYQEHLSIDGILGSEAEAFQYQLTGMSNFHIYGIFIAKDIYQDSFLIASKALIPRAVGIGNYKLKYNLGVFNFDANGVIYGELCKSLK